MSMEQGIQEPKETRPYRRRKGRYRVTSDTNPQTTLLETGLSLWAGILDEEYLYPLKDWQQAFKVFTEMADDAVIAGLLEAVKTPLIGSKFQVIAGSPEKEDMKLAERIRDDLFSLQDIEWLNHVEDMLEFLEYGFSIAEKKLAKQKDGWLHIDVLLTVGQETLDRWGPLDIRGKTTGFLQRTDISSRNDFYPASIQGTPLPQLQSNRDVTSRQPIFCPIDKLLHFTFKGRKRNPSGRSLLRSLYRSWYFKKNLESLEAIGVERDVGNAPVAKLADGVRYTKENIEKLEAALEGFRMDEALYVILPPGVELEAYGGGSKVYDVRGIIRDYQHIIRQRFFADFLALGAEGVGTQALASELTTFFSLAERAIQEHMLEVWNRQLIPWILYYNNIDLPPTRWPKLDWLNPGEQNVQAMATSYQMLAQSGILRPDKDVRDRVRLQLGHQAEREEGEEPTTPEQEINQPKPELDPQQEEISKPTLETKFSGPQSRTSHLAFELPLKGKYSRG